MEDYKDLEKALEEGNTAFREALVSLGELMVCEVAKKTLEDCKQYVKLALYNKDPEEMTEYIKKFKEGIDKAVLCREEYDKLINAMFPPADVPNLPKPSECINN